MYWLNMLETISISASAAAIFSAEEGCGRAPPKPRKDMFAVWVDRAVILCEMYQVASEMLQQKWVVALPGLIDFALLQCAPAHDGANAVQLLAGSLGHLGGSLHLVVKHPILARQ